MANVTITQGALKGGLSKTDSGFEYYEFLEIPYAKPPVGDLRFKSPAAPEPWQGVRDATSYSSDHIATQVDFGMGTVAGHEDCLYLNVFTPKLPSGDQQPKPVILFIHGGGFISGNGTMKNFNGPDYLVENDVVVVTVNYRLGVLGFLSLDIPEASGNMGLKDLVKALEWVQSNINKFGGDKDNVTILGASAGAASCEYLLLSPQAKGLFHKAILMSGSTLNDWPINYEPKKLANALALKLGFNGSVDDIRSLYEFLMKVPAEALTGVSFQVCEQFTDSRVFFGFVPIIEKEFGDGQEFLTVQPYKLLKEGKFYHVPVIKGFCNKEGTLASMMKPTAVRHVMETKRFVDSWAYKFDNNDAKAYDSKLASIYFEKLNADDETEFATDFFADLNFDAGIWVSGKLQAAKGVPTYMYRFCHDGKLNAFKVMFGLMKKGAAHGDDQGYVFRINALETHTPDEADINIRMKMTKMLTDFAKTGNPTPEGSIVGVQWPQFEENNQIYLNVDKELTIDAKLDPRKMEIFEEIYEKYKK